MQNQENNNMINQCPLVDSTWTRHDHVMFVNAVANGANGFEELVGMIPGKTADEVKVYYDSVVRELLEIETGQVELPEYPDGGSYNQTEVMKGELVVNAGSGSEPREKERKKSNPWSVDEHKRFLDGLKKFGKGDWRSISRLAVITRTATQVASHAQKFFLRQALPKEGDNINKKRKKKRYSIHDITTTDTTVASHAQPTTTITTITTTTTPPSDLSGGQSNGSQERGAQSSITLWPSVQEVTEQPMSSTQGDTSNYDTKGKGVPVEVATLSPHYFSAGQYYGGLGGEAPPPLITQQPYSCLYDGQGGEAPQPFTSYYDAQGGAQPEYELSFSDAWLP